MRMACMLPGLLGAAPALAADEAPTGTLGVTFENLRSAKGMIRACLTREPKLFLHCDRDPAAFKASVAAGPAARMEFAKVPPGDYVLAIVHDENGNSKVDTFVGIPREGVGFSRNPGMSFGPPKYEAAKFHVGVGAGAMVVKLKYFL
ncbi:MAG: DUF2141 domain-containing protein [Sphingobium sp.]|nr:DUF2141 domain-containing protein [Sphingobium sp.]